MGVNDLVKELLGSGEDPNARAMEGQTPLYLAATSNNAGAIKYLLDAGADINAPAGPRVTPLWRAAEVGSVDAVEELLKHSPLIDLAEPSRTDCSRCRSGQRSH
jgi:ankyrin repeat protein